MTRPWPVTRSTTLGALSQMRLWATPLSRGIHCRVRGLYTIDMLGDYSDPETGLEHHLLRKIMPPARRRWRCALPCSAA